MFKIHELRKSGSEIQNDCLHNRIAIHELERVQGTFFKYVCITDHDDFCIIGLLSQSNFQI